jgi:hypothetical protein
MGPVNQSVGEVGMLKASNWAEHSQRGLKETIKNMYIGSTVLE